MTELRPPATPCPGRVTLDAWAGLRLTDSEREGVLSHIDTCEGCRKTLAELMRARALEGDSVLSRADSIVEPSSLSAGGTGRAARAIPPVLAAGRYILIDLLGRGGMAEVYLAHDNLLRREVALKVLPNTASATAEEARALAAVVHRNVVMIHDVFSEGPHLILVIELVSGGSLRRWLASPRREPEIRRRFLELAAGLSAVHEAGLLHGDVKPDNALLGRDGEVKLADFGLALFASRGPARGFTPRYRAPELAEGGAATVASDIYAFGLSWLEAFGSLRQGEGQRPDLARAPRYLRPILASAIASDPAERPRSMAELMARVVKARVAVRRRTGLAVLAAVCLAAAAPPTAEAVAHAECVAGFDGRLSSFARPLSELADAPSAITLAQAGLDAWASSWRALARGVCAGEVAQPALVETCMEVERLATERLVQRLERSGARLATELSDVTERLAGRAHTLCSDEGHVARYGVEHDGRRPEPLPVETLLAVEELPQWAHTDIEVRGPRVAAELARHGPSPALWHVQRELGYAAETRGEVDLARRRYEEALLTALRLDDLPLQRRGWLNLAEMALFRESAFDEAERLRERAEAVGLAVQNNTDRERAARLASEVALGRGELTLALELAERALATAQANGERYPRLPLVDRAIALIELGDGREALEAIEQALEGRLKTTPRQHTRVAGLLRLRGLARVELGDHEAAARDLEEALAIRRAAVGPLHAETAMVELALARALAARDPSSAIEHLVPAFANLSAALPPHHIQRGRQAVDAAEVALVAGEPVLARALLDLAADELASLGLERGAWVLRLRLLEALVAERLGEIPDLEALWAVWDPGLARPGDRARAAGLVRLTAEPRTLVRGSTPGG